ncbi:MAG: hypothetical protein QOE90_769 [Thermoplasmata archaeon]|jgi:hypothetical protein|nr:hypothetical protein [Thermoplasmata archaeon]
MRIKTILNILLVASLVLGALAVFVPDASAQKTGQLTFSPVSFADPIKPLRPAVCQTSTVTITASADSYSGLIGVPVTFSVTKQPAWATVVLSPTTAIFPIQAGAGAASPTFSGTTPLQICISTTDQAPAFSNDQVAVSGTTTGQSGGAVTGGTAFQIGADYFSIIDVNLQEAVKVDRPQTPVVFPVKITNLGNANTKVTITPDTVTGDLTAPAPQPSILQSKQAGGSQISQDIQLTVQTPYHNGYLNQVGTVTYKVTSAYALDPKLTGDSSVISVVLTTRGFYVPGFEPGVLFAALAGVALVIGIRRRKA